MNHASALILFIQKTGLDQSSGMLGDGFKVFVQIFGYYIKIKMAGH